MVSCQTEITVCSSSDLNNKSLSVSRMLLGSSLLVESKASTTFARSISVKFTQTLYFRQTRMYIKIFYL